MSATIWLQLFLICLLGAMSPGPSLAVVGTNTLSKGCMHGISTGIGHGFGIVLWAFLTAAGIAKIVVETNIMLILVQLLGASFLLYLGIRTLIDKTKTDLPIFKQNKNPAPSYLISRAAGEGFLISLLNPKIALFFLAIFSHFVQPDSEWSEIASMGIMAGIIDAAWYSFIAITIARSGIIPFIKIHERLVNRIIGGFFIFVSLYLFITLTRNLL